MWSIGGSIPVERNVFTLRGERHAENQELRCPAHEGEAEKRLGKGFMAKSILARSLLRGFRQRMGRNPKPRRISMVRLGSPVADAFESFH